MAETMKLSQCPNMLYAIAKQMVAIFGLYKCTINGRHTVIVADDSNIVVTWEDE